MYRNLIKLIYDIGIVRILEENREPINISIWWEKDLINDAGKTDYPFERKLDTILHHIQK